VKNDAPLGSKKMFIFLEKVFRTKNLKKEFVEKSRKIIFIFMALWKRMPKSFQSSPHIVKIRKKS